MIPKTLEQRLNTLKNRIGLTGGRLAIHEMADACEPISASISTEDWHIEMKISEGYSPVRDEHTAKYVALRGIADPLEAICRDVVYHECGHWELPRGSGLGCPYDVFHHDLITESIHCALLKCGKESSAGYVANMFEDILVNANSRQNTSHLGQILFWNEQGMTHGKFTKLYEAFVRTNIAMWGDKRDNEFMRRFYSNDAQVNDAVKQMTHLLRNGTDLFECVQSMYKKDSWSNTASRFAQIVAPLLDEAQSHQMFGASADDGEGGRKSAFDKKLGTPDGEEDAAKSRYDKGMSKATNRDSFEQLDAFYRSIARDIPVEIETFTKSYSFPLVPYGREEFDLEQHDLLARRASIGITEDGTPGLFVNRGWIDTDETYKHNVRKFPKLRVAVIDTSGSMKQAPDGSNNVGSKAYVPWGDNSRYHYALLGKYGIDSFLERQHIAPYVDSALVNFSSKTESASGCDALKLQFTPQFGNTSLDVEVLRSQIQEGDTFLLTLSDGQIDNWKKIRDTYRDVIKGTAYAHIQIGGSTEFSSDLEKWGVKVHYVTSGEDMARMMVKVASEKYKSIGQVTQ